MKNTLMTTLFTFALLPAVALAHDYSLGTLKIHHPWTRATPPGASNAAGYATLTNTGKTDDVLTAATMEGAQSTMLHQSMKMDGVMHMNMLENGITIPAGATVELKPESFHIMAMKLSKPYVQEESISGTLTFQKAGTVPVTFKVEAIGAQAPAEMPMTHNMH